MFDCLFHHLPFRQMYNVRVFFPLCSCYMKKFKVNTLGDIHFPNNSCQALKYTQLRSMKVGVSIDYKVIFEYFQNSDNSLSHKVTNIKLATEYCLIYFNLPVYLYTAARLLIAQLLSGICLCGTKTCPGASHAP